MCLAPLPAPARDGNPDYFLTSSDIRTKELHPGLWWLRWLSPVEGLTLRPVLQNVAVAASRASCTIFARYRKMKCFTNIEQEHD
jgi:hypothetical protein